MTDRERKFQQFHDDYREKVYRLCLGFTDDRLGADDLFQEILLKVWVALPGFRGESQLATWAYRIAVNTATRYRKSTNRRGKNEVTAVDFTDLPTPDLPVENEAGSKLRKAIRSLPVNDRLVITLLLEDCSYADIAAITGYTVTNVGARISRAKQKLKKILTS